MKIEKNAGKYALTNMTLLDGRRDMKPVTGKAVVVEDGRIKDIADEGALPADMKKIDLGGGYLMPGLINMHMHLPTSGKPMKKPLNYAKAAKLLKLSAVQALFHKICENNAKTNLLAGMTTVRTVGGLPGFDTEVRNKINDGKIVGPRVITSDYAISVPGGHMTGSVALPANSVEEAVAMVDDLHTKYRPDIIKLMITGGVLDCTVPGEPGILKMPPEYVKAACGRAHELGYKVAAHVESTAGMEAAVEGGVDTIEHGGKMTDGLAAKMKEKGTVLVATLSPAMPFLGLIPDFIGISEMGLINGKALFDNMTSCIRRCLDEGIPVGLGTDTGCPYTTHYDFWREMWYLNRIIGVSPENVIWTATLRNAEIAGISDETGSVEVGKRADLIVSEKNPLENLEALRELKAVVCGNVFISEPKVKKYADVEQALDRNMTVLAEKYR